MNEKITKNIDANTPDMSAYGSCVFTCEITSHSAAKEEIMVVSEMGEQ